MSESKLYCPWCQDKRGKTDLSFGVLDEDFCQPVRRPRMIKFCPFCGRLLEDNGNNTVHLNKESVDKMRYRTKYCEIEAIKWTGTNINEICKFTHKDVGHLLVSGNLYIETLEGVMEASIGDYIIRGLNGEYYPCKPDIFHKKYELVSYEDSESENSD